MVADVVRVLEERGARFEVVSHSPATDSMHESALLGMPAGDVVKTLVLDTKAGHALAALPANKRLDMDKLREASGDRHARLATEGEIVRDLPGCELGGIPPLGSLFALPVYVDPDVFAHEVVAFAAGTQTDSVRGPAKELFQGEKVTMTPITQPGEDG
jgi:Ala-tRNA(Pro) deacylase